MIRIGLMRLGGVGAVLAIVVAGTGSAHAADANTPLAGSVADTSASGGVTFVTECSYVLVAGGVNSAVGTYVVDGATAADWPLVSTTLECAYHLSNGQVATFRSAQPGPAAAVAGTIPLPAGGGVREVCYRATGVKLDGSQVTVGWKCQT